MRKKLISITIILMVIGMLMGFGYNTNTNIERADDSLYNEILSKISASIVNGQESDTGDFSYMYPFYGSRGTSDFGYAYIQIAEKEQALVVGENGTQEYPSILYDMYVVKNGQLIHVFSGGERDRYYATNTTGAFIEEGSSSAESSFYDTFTVKAGERKSTEFYRAPGKINLTLTSFSNMNVSDKANTSVNVNTNTNINTNTNTNINTDTEVSSHEAVITDNQSNENQNVEKKSSNKRHSIEVIDDKGIIKKCQKSAKAGKKVTVKTNSFMDAIPQIEVNGNDIGTWDKNKTKYVFVMPNEDVKIITSLKSAGLS